MTEETFPTHVLGDPRPIHCKQREPFRVSVAEGTRVSRDRRVRGAIQVGREAPRTRRDI